MSTRPRYVMVCDDADAPPRPMRLEDFAAMFTWSIEQRRDGSRASWGDFHVILVAPDERGDDG